MIFSVFLRNIKTYRSTNYIPISNGSAFTAMIGANGIGKSSVLEALESYFNGAEWNLHFSLNKGFSEREPFICPVFLIEKSKINTQRNLYKYLEVVSDIVWQLEREDFNSSSSSLASEFCLHRDRFLSSHEKERFFIFPHGVIRNSKTSQEFYNSIFDGVEDFEERLKDECDVDYAIYLKEVEDFVRGHYRYIYLPSEMDFHEYTRIEGETVQALMGTKIEDIVKELIDEQHIKVINSKLNTFMDGVSGSLESYEYKKPALRQNLFNQSHLAAKVIDVYFSSKVLNLKKEQGDLVPVYNLSSGEKRKAIIDIARAFLLNSSYENKKQILLGVDEPEISLHVSACFAQFEKLKDLANRKIQTLITTHWYGFMPIVSMGSAIYMSGAKQSNHLLDLQRFRDDVKHLKEATRGSLPSNIELKSINDLVQSVIASVIGDNYKWVICEGVSDRIYLELFLDGMEKTNVLPLGGAPVVKRFFNYINLALKDERSSVQGKILFLIDTDQEYEHYEAKDIGNVVCMRRLLNNVVSKNSELLETSNKSVSPPTLIEDVLHPEVFKETMMAFLEEELDESLCGLADAMEVKYPGAPSGLAFDWRDSDKILVKHFFSKCGMKVDFAKKYASLHVGEESVPAWCGEVRDFLLKEK